MNGLLGLNTRTIGVSRDQIMSAARQIGGAFLLVQDDPALITPARSAGCRTIYRQSGDEGDALAQDPAMFVQTRAEKGADYVYLTNEVTSSDALHQWTRKAIDAATAQGVKLVLYNYGTNAARLQWEAALPNLRYAVERGHAVGVHCYFDGAHDAGAYGWLDIKHLVGGMWLVTEFGSIRDISDAYHGWRGRLSPAQYGDFMRGYGAHFEAEQMPVLVFSGDNWPANEQGKASGFGVLDTPDVIAEIAAVNRLYQWKGIPVTPPPVIQIPTNPGPALSATVIESGVRLRSAPILNDATFIRNLALNEVVATHPMTRTNVSGYPFQFTETATGDGWAAIADTDGDVWIKTDAPPQSWTVSLAVPYVSQTDANASASNNDCGIASLLMLQRAWMVAHGLAMADVPTVNDLTKYTALAAPTPPKGLTFDQIGALSRRCGYLARYLQPLSEAQIVALLDAGSPVMVLLDYSVYNPASKPLAHILVISGYNNMQFLTQDPYLLGKNVAVERARLMRAMQSSPGNSVGYQGMVLA